jgi:D-alanyl-D-alanine carboxypeptidase
VSEATGEPIPTTTLADSVGFGLGVQQATSPQLGTEWDYIGGTLGHRVGHVYFPRSGIIIAFGVNSATDQDNEALGALEVSVYQTLQNAGAAQGG